MNRYEGTLMEGLLNGRLEKKLAVEKESHWELLKKIRLGTHYSYSNSTQFTKDFDHDHTVIKIFSPRLFPTCSFTAHTTYLMFEVVC